MTSAADEEWSIISSSDLEDDSGSSHTELRQGSTNRDNFEDDLAAASVCTVRPESKSSNFVGSKIRVASTTESLGVATALNQASGTNAKGSPATIESVGAGNPTLAPSASFFAPLSASRKAARQSVARSAQYFCETDAAIKDYSRNLFHRPIAQLHRRANQLSSPTLRTVSIAALGRLDEQKQFILYFVIATVITFCGGGVLGTKALISRSSGVSSDSRSVNSVWVHGISKFGALWGHSHTVPFWAHSSALWLTRLKDTSCQTASRALNFALYEDHHEKRTWIDRFYQHSPSRQLRLSRVCGAVNVQIHSWWNSAQGIPTSQFVKSLKQNVRVQDISNYSASLCDTIRRLGTEFQIHSRLGQLKLELPFFDEKSVHAYKSLALQSWHTIKSSTLSGIGPGTEILKKFFTVGSGTSKEFQEFVSNVSKELSTKFETIWISFKARKWGSSVSQIAHECSASIDTAQKRADLLDSLKRTSQSGVKIFTRRLQLATLEAYRASKSVAASLSW